MGFDPGAAFRASTRLRSTGRRAAAARPRAAGAPAATLMLLDCGDRVIELYGASARREPRHARTTSSSGRPSGIAARGMARYDMWGTDEEGVATFKASFGGAERQYIGAWRLVTDPRGASVVAAADRVAPRFAGCATGASSLWAPCSRATARSPRTHRMVGTP